MAGGKEENFLRERQEGEKRTFKRLSNAVCVFLVLCVRGEKELKHKLILRKERLTLF